MKRLSVDLPEDWVKFGQEALARLDPAKVRVAVDGLKTKISVKQAKHIVALITKDPQRWWVVHHFWGGMAVRNTLRRLGYGEKFFDVGNMDDYYVPILEMAARERADE